ncbi:MAG: hypothetical protein AB7K24_29530 [Gemmataceae bacterium]
MVEAEMLVSRILEDEGLTSALEEPEAQRLIDWLVKQTERIAAAAQSEAEGEQRVNALCRRARAVGKLIEAACYQGERDEAARLAARQQLPWPVPAHAGPALDMLLDHLANSI